MATTCHRLNLVLSAILLISNSFTNAQPSFRPKALLLPITKDALTLQYLTVINQRTPLVSINVVVDLGGEQLWVDCDNQFYNSSSYSSLRCGSSQCTRALAKACSICDTPPPPGCFNTCGRDPQNSVAGSSTMGSLGEDVFSIQSTNGKNPGPAARIPRFLFICATLRGSPPILQGLASGAQGMAGLGRAPIALPSQLAAAFSFNRKFGLCLPSSIRANGVVFFGNTPYTMLPNIDISNSLMYTPLLLNPVSTAGSYFLGESSTEYFIGVKSIKVNDKPIALNASLLTIIQDDGYGGTKISTVDPYTVLETSIYKALTSAFVREAKLTRVASVAPFEFCFSSKNVGSTRVGPAVPSIDLVLQSENVYWRIFGANSMVQVRDGVLCLGFVDGGVLGELREGGGSTRTSIVIGAHQIEDNLLLFDLASSRLGFSSSLLFSQTTCSNFNFTSTA